jgi:hypothetical protein
LRGCTKNIAVRENIFGAEKSGKIARKKSLRAMRVKIQRP